MAKNSNYVVHKINQAAAADPVEKYAIDRVMEAVVTFKPMDENLRMTDLPKVRKSADAVDILRPWYEHIMHDHEMFSMLALNHQNYVIAKVMISHGGQASTLVDPKIVFRRALVLGAASIIVAHNHPSGQIFPSDQDLQITLKLKECARHLEIQLLDSLIITDSAFYSFADEGKI